jgi:rsbT co-antagonist protein RsbR
MSLSILVDEVFPVDALGDRRSGAVRAMTKLLHLDTAIVVDTYNRQTNDRIVGQARALMEMSTPVTALGDEILMLPVVGIIDSRRAQDIMSSVLTRIAETRARVFIIDISGVSVVDTAVANYLIKVARATRLMGCRCLLSGLSPAVAQTIIELGIDVAGIETRATLRDALE